MRPVRAPPQLRVGALPIPQNCSARKGKSCGEAGGAGERSRVGSRSGSERPVCEWPPRRSALTLRHFPDTRVTAQRSSGGAGWGSACSRPLPQLAGAANKWPEFILRAFCPRKEWGEKGLPAARGGRRAGGAEPAGSVPQGARAPGSGRGQAGPAGSRLAAAGPRCSQSAEGHCQKPAARHPLRCLVSGVRVEIPLSSGKALAQMTQKGLVWSVRALRSVSAGLLKEGELFPSALRWATACGWRWDTGTESLLDSSVSRRGGIVLGKIPFLLFFPSTMCPLIKRSTVCIIMKFLNTFPLL